MSKPDEDQQLGFAVDADGVTGARIAPARLGRDEMNLAEFPFALLADRAPKSINTIKFEDDVEGKDGELVKRIWTVTGGESFGLPVASDEEVYVALMEITKEQGFDQRSISITRYDLIKRLGWPDKGDSYRRLRGALDRLLAVTIKAEKAFWDKEKQRYVDVGFHIIDDYALYDEAPGRKRRGHQDTLPLSFISWNQVIFRSFQVGNIKQLDTAFFFGLRSSISRRLFRYLDKKRYDGKATFRIRIKKLAFEKLGMSRNYYPSHIKQELKRAHDELLETGFLTRIDYEKPKGREEERVVYHFTRRKYLTPESRPTVEQTPELVDELVDAGVTRGVAGKLVRDFGDEARLQLQYLPYRSAQEPAAVLVESIKGKWEPPASYLKARAEKQRRLEKQRLQKAEDAERAQQEAALELTRQAALAALNRLDRGTRPLVIEQAKQRVIDKNPVVAQHPRSRAFQAMQEEETRSIIQDDYAELFREEKERLEQEDRLDLNDDI